MNDSQFEQGTPNRESHKNDLVVLNNKVPVVYTTKLDDMWFFRQTIKNIRKDDITDCIICESFPVLTRNELDVKPRTGDFNSYSDLKVKINQIFDKHWLKSSHKSHRRNLKKVQLSKQGYYKNVESDSRLDNQPASKSESQNDEFNMFITVIDCNGRQSLCTLNDFNDKLRNVNLTLGNRTFNEHDIYIFDNDGRVKEFRTVNGNDTKLYETDRNQNKIVIEFCCWVQRNESVYKMYPNYLSLPSLKFILKSHKCLPNQCLCCCRNFNDDDEPETTDQSISFTMNSKKRLTKIEIISSYNWIGDLIEDKKYCNNLIDRALNCTGDMTTIRAETKQRLQNEIKINKRTEKKKFHTLTNTSTIEFLKLQNQQATIYKFNSLNRCLFSVSNMNPYKTNLKAIGFKYSHGCCWKSRTNKINKVLNKTCRNITELYTGPHLCPIDYCKCCCQKKPDTTNIQKRANQNQDSANKTQGDKESVKSKTANKSKRYKIKSETTKRNELNKNLTDTPTLYSDSTDCNMTKAYVQKESKYICQKKPDATNIQKRANKNQHCANKTQGHKESVKSKTVNKSKSFKIKSKITKKNKRDKNFTDTPTSCSDSTDCDMTIAYVQKQSKYIWEKFQNLRITITKEGRVSAQVLPRVSSLSTEEVNAVSKILISAEKQMKRQSFPPGTSLDVRIEEKNNDCVKIKLEIVKEKSKEINNVKDDAQEPKIEEQALSPMMVENESLKAPKSELEEVEELSVSQIKLTDVKVISFCSFENLKSEEQALSPTMVENANLPVPKSELEEEEELSLSPTMVENESLLTPKSELEEIEELSLSQIKLIDVKGISLCSFENLNKIEIMDSEEQALSPTMVENESLQAPKSEVEEVEELSLLPTMVENRSLQAPKSEIEEVEELSLSQIKLNDVRGISLCSFENLNNIEIIDSEEQALSPPMVLESVEIDESRNITTIRMESQQKNNPKVLEHQPYSFITGHNNRFISVSETKNKADKFNDEHENLQAPKSELEKGKEFSLSKIKLNDVKERSMCSFENFNNDQNNAEVFPKIRQSSHSTSAENNFSQAPCHISASKRKLEKDINVHPKIRVVSPSKLGVEPDSKSTTTFMVIDPYNLEVNSTLKSSKLTKAEVACRPNEYHIVPNRAEVPKFIKILPKPLVLPKNIVKIKRKKKYTYVDQRRQ